MINYQLPSDDIAFLNSYPGADIAKAFDYIANHSHLTFDFPQGGCQQRSHAMSMLLHKKFSVQHCKVWIFAPAALYDFDERTLFVEDKNQLSPSNTVHWNYHTAPMVKQTEGKKTEYMIIDPSLNRDKPLPIGDWMQAMGNSECCRYTFLMPEKYFFNCKYNDYSQLTNVFDGTFFEFTNPAKDNLVLEKGLAVNDMAILIFKKHIEPLMTASLIKNETKLQDLKDIFGNATALDLLFAQNLSGNTNNTSYRYVLGNYGAIMKEAKQVFHERLIFWTKFTNELLGDN